MERSLAFNGGFLCRDQLARVRSRGTTGGRASGPLPLRQSRVQVCDHPHGHVAVRLALFRTGLLCRLLPGGQQGHLLAFRDLSRRLVGLPVQRDPASLLAGPDLPGTVDRHQRRECRDLPDGAGLQPLLSALYLDLRRLRCPLWTQLPQCRLGGEHRLLQRGPAADRWLDGRTAGGRLLPAGAVRPAPVPAPAARQALPCAAGGGALGPGAGAVPLHHDPGTAGPLGRHPRRRPKTAGDAADPPAGGVRGDHRLVGGAVERADRRRARFLPHRVQ